MIGSILRVVFFGLLGLALTWGGRLLTSTGLKAMVRQDDAAFQLAFARRPATVLAPPESLDRFAVRMFLPLDAQTFQDAGTLIARRGTVAKSFIPFWLVFFAAGILAGAVLRERLARGTAYASPTISFLSKRALELSIALFITWTFAPLPLAYWLFYPLAFGVMGSSAGYVANLPLRV